MTRARQLREKRAALVAQAQALLPREGSLTAEIRRKFDSMMAEVDDLKDEIAREELANVDAELRFTTRPHEAPIGRVEESGEDPQYRAAFRDFLRNGLHASNYDRGMSPENRERLTRFRDSRERRDMGIGVPTQGGYFVPQGFV